MSMENVYQYIEQLMNYPYKKTNSLLSLSGGEVFLRYQDLKKLLLTQNKSAYRFLYDQWFWGKDDQQAKDWIRN